MHLLAATPGAIDDGTAPFDLGQTPADIVFISAADTELAAMSEARAHLKTPPKMRLANLTFLRHPMSVDQHISDCALGAKLVIARVLGGTGYWPYGTEQYAARLGAAGIPFIVLPGDDKPDQTLLDLSSIKGDDWHNLWAYLVEGGPENTQNFLRYATAIIADKPRPNLAKPLLKAGVYWPAAAQADMELLRSNWHDDAPIVPIVFYRALLQGAGLNPINRLVKSLLRRGLNPMPIFVASLKDPLSQGVLEQLFTQAPPSVIINCTSFATGSFDDAGAQSANPYLRPSANRAIVFQAVLSSGDETVWQDSTAGLSARDIAMNVALPELDGRVLSRAISFKSESYFDDATQCAITSYRARGDRVEFVADLVKNFTALRRANNADKKVGLLLANYPNKDGRLANGVGLDTPQATVDMLHELGAQGYSTCNLPDSAQVLMDRIMAGPTNWLTQRNERSGGQRLALSDYLEYYETLPFEVKDQIETRWGQPDADPFYDADGFALSIFEFGNLCVGVQPARGYNIDPKDTYHSPDLIPPHNYLAFYFYLRHKWGANALVHMGKHGNLEWLPGKALALSDECWPEIALGPTPNFYPFIVNDPGEGTQAKRRISAVIIDHLTPPLTRAEAYGPLKQLESLVDEYYQAAGLDPKRVAYLRNEILSFSAATGIDQDAGLSGDHDDDLAKLDGYLCDLKEAQIRDGLHIFGRAPDGRLARDLTAALLRLPRGDGQGGNDSLIRALTRDFDLNFDPLDCDMGAQWTGPKPDALASMCKDPWRSYGDTVERLELLALDLLDGQSARDEWRNTRAVLDYAKAHVMPTVQACGPSERQGLIDGLNGLAILAGPSGAPTRGRLDVLPTGRNFYSVDSRAIPSPAAWALGWKSANLLIEKHLQTHGDWPHALLLTAWGTANMRTGGDDIAQALALMGVKPTWDSANARVTGFDILPQSVLDRPRVDVTLRISGFFRDAFPAAVALIDSAARAIQALDEPIDVNPAAHAGGDGARVFGAKPGAYGAGLQAMIDERLWSDHADLAAAYLEWGSYAYGKDGDGQQRKAAFSTRLSQVDAIVQNQDNREHDVLDSDDYYQFEGGAAAAVKTLQGRDRPIYHNDHSRPERPIIRTLDDEIGRVIRSRVVNPKWINGVKRHGYKGAFEMAATLDYLFAFAATTGVVKNHHFDLVESAFIADDDTREFIAQHNPPALLEMAQRLAEAIERGLWVPKSNSARARVEELLRPSK